MRAPGRGLSHPVPLLLGVLRAQVGVRGGVAAGLDSILVSSSWNLPGNSRFFLFSKTGIRGLWLAGSTMEPEQMLEGQTQVPESPGFRVVVWSKEEWLMFLWPVFCFLGCRKSPLWVRSHRQRRGNLSSSYAVSLRLLWTGENLGFIFTRLLCTRENFIVTNEIVSNYGKLVLLAVLILRGMQTYTSAESRGWILKII